MRTTHAKGEAVDYPEIVEAFDSNLRADPYGTAMAIIREVLEFVLDDGISGSMSESEFSTLDAVARVIGHDDPDSAPHPRPA